MGKYFYVMVKKCSLKYENPIEIDDDYMTEEDEDSDE